MRLISSKKTKRRIALLFVFAFMLSNLLSLVGPSAQAAITITAPSAGTCFQHNGTAASGALVTVYSIGTIQISLTASEISPGKDAAATSTGTNNSVAKATDTLGTISIGGAGGAVGNVFTFIPPSGTNFVVVPGFQSTNANEANLISAPNATISNAISTDSTTGTPESLLGISVGVITNGTSGVGRAIVALAVDADTSSTSFAGTETYPKTNTGSNTATIAITGLGIAIPPSGEVSLSGTLQATLDANPPSGIAAVVTALTTTGAVNGTTRTAAAAIPGLSGTINLCTITAAGGQLIAESDTDTDTTDLYDKQVATANLLALNQLTAGLSAVHAFDTRTVTTSVTVNGTAGGLVDLEPILIRGAAGSGSATRDQVIGTAALLQDIEVLAEFPSGSSLDPNTFFGSGATSNTPITVAFSDDNATAISTLQAVDINIGHTTAGSANPTATGFSTAQTSRNGFLGALRAAILNGNNSTSTGTFATGANWGVGAFSGGPTRPLLQEATHVGADALLAGNASGKAANATLEPFNDNLVDLRILCTSGTNPVAGWFAILSSGTSALTGLDTLSGTASENRGQILRQSQAGGKIPVTNASPAVTLFTQSLTQITGTNPTVSFVGGRDADGGLDTSGADNVLLYASCANNVLTIIPVQNGFDNTRDIIAVTPRILITNVSTTLTSDVNLQADVSGNNATGTTSIMLAKLVGAPPATSTLASAQGVAVSETGQLGIDCSSGGQSSVTLSSVSTGTITTAATNACTSGAIASPPAFFTGGANNTVSGTTVVKGSPVAQGEARGILITESTATGFSELVSQIGGGVAGALFEIGLPSGCDLIDDNDDNNTATSSSSSSSATGGNDVSMITLASTAGVTATVTGGGTGDALLTSSNVLAPAVGSTPAKVRLRLSAATGTGTDALTTDGVLVKFDSQDIFCPTSVTGDLFATVTAQNKVSGPTVTSSLGTMVALGTATKALSFAFGDDTATSTKGETSTNMNIGPTPRLVGGGASNSHVFVITELNKKAIPIGGRVSPRNLDSDNTLLSTVLTRGQLWIIPAAGSAFSAAPALADVTTTNLEGTTPGSLVVDGSPLLVTSSSVDANAPIGSVIIGLKKNTASGAPDPATITSVVTVKNLKLTAATSSTTDLVADVEFYAQDVGVVVNTPGVASANSSSSPTLFTPFTAGATKALTQLEVAGAQLSGSLANQLAINRDAVLESPQISPFANQLTTQMNADGSKITVAASAIAASSSGTAPTDNKITVTGTAGAVDNGAEVIITTGGTTTYDSVTVVASNDGSLTGNLRGDCAPPATSVSVSVTEQVSGTKTTSVTKTVLCSGQVGGVTEDSVFTEIAGSDGVATVSEVLTYVSSNGGLAAIVSAGGGKLAGVIKAAKSALGLS